MGRKKNAPTQSQTLGILWLSVALLLIVAVAFFSGHKGGSTPPNSTTGDTLEEILAQKEDSAYRSRRPKRNTRQYNNDLRDNKRHLDSTFYTTEPPRPVKQPLVVDLNTADTLTLQLLHGIGPAYARRIVRYRERLGGFVSSSQLLEVYGFTPELLAHIAPHLTLDSTAIVRIDINSIDLKQLARHPYVEYYQARDIVRLRSLGTRFRTADDLRAVPSMADSTLERLLPYVDFGDSI